MRKDGGLRLNYNLLYFFRHSDQLCPFEKGWPKNCLKKKAEDTTQYLDVSSALIYGERYRIEPVTQ